MGQQKWPDDLRASIEAMLRAGSTPREIRALYESKGVECPPLGTIRYWASAAGISTAPRTAAAPRARVEPTKAEDLPDGIRDRLTRFVDRSLVHLDTPEAITNARNTKALVDSLEGVLGMIPDLLTIEEKLSPDGSNPRESRRRQLAELVRKRGLGRDGG